MAIGKFLMTFAAAFTTLGTFVADYSKTHVLNPRWPPHARFHNGQTMTLSVVTLLLVVYYLYRPLPAPSEAVERDSLWTAAVIGTIYCGSAMTGVLYPGAEGTDPEFGEGFPQKWLFTGLIILNWAGWGWERGHLSGVVPKVRFVARKGGWAVG